MKTKAHIVVLAIALGSSTSALFGQGSNPPPPPPDGQRPPPREGGAGGAGGGKERGAKRYSIEQAISDQAQLRTIAFDGLAFLTGDINGDTFLPPGKVSDYFGFQYMRDIDAKEGGHKNAAHTHAHLRRIGPHAMCQGDECGLQEARGRAWVLWDVQGDYREITGRLWNVLQRAHTSVDTLN